jgi:hypothetical protein
VLWKVGADHAACDTLTMRLPCLLRGHHWVTARDSAGSLTTCTRCKALRHQRVESAAHGHFKAHMNLAVEWAPLPAHGAEELAAEPEA